jgi:anti-sigma factor RsiW
MMHTNEGTLRAYLDGELDERVCAAVAAHLRECTTCRRQLESLASRVSAASQRLQALAPRAAELPAPAPVALSRLRRRLSGEQDSRPARSAPYRPTGGLIEMFKQMLNSRYRAAGVGLAAMLVVASLFAFAPVRAAASQFLGLFRVRKFAVVSINPAALQNLEQAGGQIDQLLSDSVTFAKEPGQPVAVASAAEAAQKAGFPVRLPSAAASAPRLRVEDGVNATLKVDLARVRSVLELAGRSDIKLPNALDGANVEFNVPPSVVAQYDCPSPQPGPAAPMPDLSQPPLRAQALSNCVTLVQLASPTLNTPPGVDLGQVGEAMLELLGLSPAEAQHFAQTIDWSSTLVIPLPTDASSFRDVTVDGAPGVLIQSNPRSSGGPRASHYTLLWEKNGMVYSLTGTGDATRGVEIADSLQ